MNFFSFNKIKHFLSLVIIVKDEDAYLEEFVAYYQLLGVDHFYFYDNDSVNPVADILKKYEKNITVKRISGRAKQMQAYRHYLKTYGSATRWAGFIDLDEFIVPKHTYTLSEMLQGYETADALGINWTLFGHNHHEKQPVGLVVENYTKREGRQNMHIKTIANPKKTKHVGNPHYFVMKEGAQYVDAKYCPIINAFNENPSLDIVQINHYFTKSAEEFIKKAARGRADTGEYRNVAIEFEQFKDIWNEYTDTCLVDKYLVDLKKKMNV